jgi:hypothetical protein
MLLAGELFQLRQGGLPGRQRRWERLGRAWRLGRGWRERFLGSRSGWMLLRV